MPLSNPSLPGKLKVDGEADAKKGKHETIYSATSISCFAKFLSATSEEPFRYLKRPLQH